MSIRTSHSYLDPVLGPQLKKLYKVLPIPRRFPPEGIILIGHTLAILGSLGFAYSLSTWWGGILAALGVIGNHTADCLDGTHARSTNQCRHGGELLDHFTDPLSFAYWLVGLAVAVGRLDIGIAAVITLFAHAILTNIRAKLSDEFELGVFGPTEFKALLVAMALGAGVLFNAGFPARVAWGTITLASLTTLGLVLLLFELVTSVRKVNQSPRQIDTTEWQTRNRRPT